MTGSPADRDAAAAAFARTLRTRVTARTGVRRRALGSGRLVGAVGRSTLGFSRAVGRNAHARPAVVPANLTSTRLRPPAGWWHTLADQPDEAVPAAPTPSWTEALLPAPQPPTRGRPTATPRDDASAKPGTPAPTAASAPAPRTPAARAGSPSGATRLDALREFLIRRGELAPEPAPPADGAVGERPNTEPERPGGLAPAGAPPTALPGAFARRLRPECVDTTVPAGMVVDSSAPAAPPPVPGGRPGGAGPATAGPRTTGAAAPSRLDALREFLIARGELPADPGAAEPPAPSRAVVRRSPSPRPWPGDARPRPDQIARGATDPRGSTGTPRRAGRRPDPAGSPGTPSSDPAPNAGSEPPGVTGRAALAALARASGSLPTAADATGQSPTDRTDPAGRVTDLRAQRLISERPRPTALRPLPSAGDGRPDDRGDGDAPADPPVASDGHVPDAHPTVRRSPADASHRPDTAAAPTDTSTAPADAERTTRPSADAIGDAAAAPAAGDRTTPRAPAPVERSRAADRMAPDPGPDAPAGIDRTHDVAPPHRAAPRPAHHDPDGQADDPPRTATPPRPAHHDPDAQADEPPRTATPPRPAHHDPDALADDPSPRPAHQNADRLADEPPHTAHHDPDGRTADTRPHDAAPSRGDRAAADSDRPLPVAPPAVRRPGELELRPIPELPGRDRDPAVLRRVTLPRALSRHHRPTRVTMPDAAPAGEAHRAGRPSGRLPGGVPAPAAPHAAAARTRVLERIGPDATSDAPPASPPEATDEPAAASLPGRPPIVRRHPAQAPADIDPPADPDQPPRSARGAELVSRFTRELERVGTPTTVALPAPFRPMARAIAGTERVLLSTDTASRRALRAVGKRAATTGSTIHVDAPLPALTAPDRRLTEIVAHELTHVAHPSPAPRFFDDVDESPEERRAEQVAALIARSPLSPAAAGYGAHRAARRTTQESPTMHHAPSPSSGAVPAVVRRTPAGTVSAAELAARHLGVTPPPAAPGTGATIRRSPVELEPAPASAPAAPAHPAAPDPGPVAGAARPFDERFREELERNIDLIIRRVEERLLTEIERRGGRAWRGF